MTRPPGPRGEGVVSARIKSSNVGESMPPSLFSAEKILPPFVWVAGLHVLPQPLVSALGPSSRIPISVDYWQYVHSRD